MNKLRFSFATMLLGVLLTTVGLGLLPGCDVVEYPVPPRTVESAGRRDTLALDSAEARWLAEPGHATPRQRVLIEDYTGHTCGNCPRAADKIQELQAQLGDTLVVVAAHVGYFADTVKAGYRYEFRTPAGEELNRVFSIDNAGLPQGMINRTPPTASASPVQALGAWPALVAAQTARLPEQQLILTALRAEPSRALRLKITSKYLVAQPGRSYRLVLNYVEDTLTRAQKDYALPAPSDIPRYLHRHILRDAPLTTFGTLNAVAPVAGQSVATYLRYPLPDAPWATRPAHVVAYLLDATDPEAKRWRVVQVVETKL